MSIRRDTRLDLVFNAYAGREVAACVNPDPRTGAAPFKLDPQDPALAELRAAVASIGYHLRVLTPASVVTRDYRIDRVNIRVELDDTGTARIANSFTIG